MILKVFFSNNQQVKVKVHPEHVIRVQESVLKGLLPESVTYQAYNNDGKLITGVQAFNKDHVTLFTLFEGELTKKGLEV